MFFHLLLTSLISLFPITTTYRMSFFPSPMTETCLCPPAHVFRSILYNRSKCSTKQDLDEALALKTKIWRTQGYTRTAIKQAKIRTLNLTQQLLLWPTETFRCDLSCAVCPFVSPALSVKDSNSNNVSTILSIITCETNNVICVTLWPLLP